MTSVNVVFESNGCRLAVEESKSPTVASLYIESKAGRWEEIARAEVRPINGGIQCNTRHFTADTEVLRQALTQLLGQVLFIAWSGGWKKEGP